MAFLLLGVFRCGPCPVKAIKEGEVYIPYDGGFIFGEVNGDRVYWDVDDDGEMEATYIDKNSIGAKISTKAVGSNDRQDLTNDYKYKEGEFTKPQGKTVILDPKFKLINSVSSFNTFLLFKNRIIP